MPCPQMTADLRPTLLFIDGKAFDERLYLACFPGGVVQKQELAHAKYLQVTQLDHPHLSGLHVGRLRGQGRVRDGPGSRHRRAAFPQALGFTACRIGSPTRQSHAYPLRSEYRRGTGTWSSTLKTLRLTLSRTFKKTDLGDKFINISPSTALSPDFQQVAYMAR